MKNCTHELPSNSHSHQHKNLIESMPDSYIKTLQLVFLLSTLCFGTQLAVAILSNSLSIWADAGHKFADLGALGLALVAAWFSRLKAPTQNTFGYYRAEIIAGLSNGIILFGLSVYFASQALSRLFTPTHIELDGTLMFVGAGLGLIINMIAASLLFKAKNKNLNAKGAFYHLLTDVIHGGSEIIVALSIVMFRQNWLDSVLGLFLVTFMLFNAFRICKEALRVLMSFSPQALSVDAITAFLQSQPEVQTIDDIHIWSITTGKHVLNAHITLKNKSEFSAKTTSRLEQVIRSKYDICNITLQLHI